MASTHAVTEPNISEIRDLGQAVQDELLATCDQVGQEVIQNMGLIRMLDDVREDSGRRAKRRYDEMTAGSSSNAPVVQSCVRAALTASDATLALADSSYTILDTAVTALDRKLKFLESLLRAQSGLSGQAASQPAGPEGDASGRSRRGAAASSSSSASALASSRSLAALALSHQTVGGVDEHGRKKRRGLRAMAGVLDLDVDPDEPTYCSCGQVAFGEMIACDSSTCPIEWYHCMCVGITPSNKPTSKWLCPLCAKEAPGPPKDAGSKDGTGHGAGSGVGSSSGR